MRACGAPLAFALTVCVDAHSLLEQILAHSGVERSDEEHNALIARIRELAERVRVASDRAADNKEPTMSQSEARAQLQALLAEVRADAAALALLERLERVE